MNTESLRELIRDLFTLRTVWIDKGQGRWTVRKRLHPVLRGALCTVAVILCAIVYASLPVSVENSENIAANLPEPPELNSPSENMSVIIPLMTVATTPQPEITTAEENIPPSPEPEHAPAKINAYDLFAGLTFNDEAYRIFVNKSEYTLSLFRGEELVKIYSIAVGKNPGDKQRVGDNRTPVGDFRVVSIENASTWKHDFRDGKGKIKGAYGPWFLRLDANGWKGIGIHGTHDPDSRGTNATEGCIRLSNEDISELRQYAYRNMPVVIREN